MNDPDDFMDPEMMDNLGIDEFGATEMLGYPLDPNTFPEMHWEDEDE